MSLEITEKRRDPFAFIDLARLGRNDFWSYVRGILWIAFFYALVTAAAIYILRSLDHTNGPSMFVRMVLLFLSTYGLFIGVDHAAQRTHGRPALSLVSIDLRLDYRRLLLGAAIWLGIDVILVIVDLVTSNAHVAPWNPSWPLFVVGAIVMVPIQAAGEELVFRGYLTQALGQVIRNRGLVALIVAIPFAALHGTYHGSLSLPFYVLTSLFLSVVTLRDQRLELAIGIHAAQNIAGVVLEGSPDPRLTFPALVQSNSVEVSATDLAGLLAGAAVFFAVAFSLLERDRRLAAKARG
ncbi:MAG TPA: type II CAAX endopeptidase family protein [Stellaceae bacterium]|nr:type II CAAX endopeptidase family protein [Stellaceae bacterium]